MLHIEICIYSKRAFLLPVTKSKYLLFSFWYRGLLYIKVVFSGLYFLTRTAVAFCKVTDNALQLKFIKVVLPVFIAHCQTMSYLHI